MCEPVVAGNTQHRYKEAIDLIEEASPGTKHQMYFGFLKRASSKFTADSASAEVVACARCGAPTLTPSAGAPMCSFCKTKALAHKRRDQRAAPRPRLRSSRG